MNEDLLQAYVDELLTPAQRYEVERYLAQHPAEADRVSTYQRQRDMIKAAFDDVLREPIPARIGARRGDVGGNRLLRLAAVLAWLAIGTSLGWTLRDQQEPTPAAKAAVAADAELVQRARAAHVVYSAETRRAVEVAASQEQDMIRWLSKRMNAAVRVPKLSEFGFEALGGRLLPGSQGPACQIMYQNAQGKRLTIYLAREPGVAKRLHFSDEELVHVVFWSDGTLAFAVSAELPNEELARIAAVIARESGRRS